MKRIVAALVLVLFCAEFVEAGPLRRLRARRSGNCYTTTGGNYTYGGASYYGGGPQAVAEAKASNAAAWGAKGHLGGGFGGCNAEGVGFSSYSAQQALNNCCFTGQRAVAGSAVVRGADGWYAVKLYW